MSLATAISPLRTTDAKTQPARLKRASQYSILAIIRQIQFKGAWRHMFTPEFSARDATEHTLVMNHFVETDEALALSIAFVRARIHYGRQHVPSRVAKFVAYYDIRGQKVDDDLETRLTDALQDVAEVRVKRS